MNVSQNQEYSSADAEVPLVVAESHPDSASSKVYQKSKNHRSEFSVVSPASINFICKNFPDITIDKWNSWKWQIQNSERFTIGCA